MKLKNTFIAILLVSVLVVPLGYYQPTPAEAQTTQSGPSVAQLGQLVGAIGGLIGGQFGGVLSTIGNLMSGGGLGNLLGAGGLSGLLGSGGLGGLTGALTGGGLTGLPGSTVSPSGGGGGGGGGGYPVNIINDSAPTSIQRTRNIALIERSNATIAEQITSLTLKETQLDPAAWNMSKQLQQQLTSNTLKWLGGQLPGQNGQVPFIQNYSEYTTRIRDDAASQFFSSNRASGLCSAEEDFKVKEYVYKSYTESRRSDQSMFQCTDSNANGSASSTQPDALTSMFASNLSCTNVTCAGYYADYQLATEEGNAFSNEDKITNLTQGMLPQRLCRNVPSGTANGTTTTEYRCDLINPPFMTADTVSFQISQMPGLQLLNQDEFSERVTNMMSNMSNQAIQSPAGILGMSGNPNYSLNIFGADGNLSYVDALLNDNILDYQTPTKSPIKEALEAEQLHAVMQIDILYKIAEIEDELLEHREEFGSCFDLSLSADLITAKGTATSSLNISTSSIVILTGLDKQYEEAVDANARNTVVNSFMSYKTQGYFRTEYDNQLFKVIYFDVTFAKMVADFQGKMAVEVEACDDDSPPSSSPTNNTQ